MKKYICWLLLPLLLHMPVFAADGASDVVTVELFGGAAVLMDSQGEIQAEMPGAAEDDGSYTFTVIPGQTYYLPLGTPDSEKTMLYSEETGDFHGPVKASDLANSDLFQMKNNKSGSGAGLVSVAQYNEKTLGELERRSWIQFVVANTVSVEELTARCALHFSARRDHQGSLYNEGDTASVEVVLYIQTLVLQSGETLDTGEDALFQPNAGEKNEIEWDGVATLSFTASTDPESFQFALETQGSEFYSLGDFSDAELFVRDFSKMPVLEAGSKALLTLKNPWVERGDISPPNPEQCRIYEYDATAQRATDVTALFTYQQNGWQMKTRRPGCYILSDKELDLTQRRVRTAGATVESDVVSEEALPQQSVPETVEDAQPEVDGVTKNTDTLTWPYPKKVPNTGKADYSNLKID